jgi:hypothetical protein
MSQAKLMTTEAAAGLLRAGKSLLVAGDHAALEKLPRGQWIGGTIPYFMTDAGGVVDRERVFVNVLPPELPLDSVKLYDAEALKAVYEEGPAEGVSFIIIPASSPTHLAFAQEAQSYPGFLAKPLVGWISGVHLEDLGRVAPAVVDGTTGEVSRDKAVVMHCGLPAGMAANLDIINLFTQGDGDTLTFEQGGFSARSVLVNGERRSFAKYIAEKGIDTKLPLVADCYGAMINASFQAVDAENDEVKLYAPVFPGVEYRIAKPVADYVADFSAAVPEGAKGASFACNCILNFLYGELEGKQTKDAVGPVTFGEIAYQLLNQTFVYVEVV